MVAIRRSMGQRPAVPGAAPRGAAPGAHAWVVGLLLFVWVLSGYLLSYNVDQPAHNGDWYIRYQVTCSIVEHNSVAITPYQRDNRTGPGLHGQTYAQYTLGQTTAMIPFYLLGRRLAGLAHTNCASPIAPPIVLLTCKLLGPLLGALLAVLFYATARLLVYPRRTALTLTALLAFGSSLWPDVQSNLEHTLESLCVLAAAYAALRYTTQLTGEGPRAPEGPRRLWLVALGLAAGLVVVTRVAGVFVPVLFALYLLLLWRRRVPAGRRPVWHDLACYAGGVLPALLITALYDVARFGAPWRLEPHGDASFGYPPWFGLPNLLISPGKGLLWYTPAVLLLALAIGPFRRRLPLPTLLFTLLCGGYLLFYSNVTYWHGDPAWGPRYLYATLPYLILPLGEVFARWRAYRPSLRAALVGVLALSFLVQFSAVTVSYWRSFHYVFAHYPDQIDRYSWGFNMNYFWTPEQSPVLLSLQGIAAITGQTVDHAPLVRHAVTERLGSGNESCYFPVYHRATLCLTDLDALRLRAGVNTFTPWWLHTYPWWSRPTVSALVLMLVALCAISGGALLRLSSHFSGPARAQAGRSHGAPRDPSRADEDERAPLRLPIVGAACVRPGGAAPRTMGVPPSTTGVTAGGGATLPGVAWTATPPVVARVLGGLGPLGVAALVGALVYGSIATAGAVSAPHRVPPMVRTVALGTLVIDGPLAYRVLGSTRVRIADRTLGITPQQAVQFGLHPADRSGAYGDYAIVRVWLRNLSPRRWRSLHRYTFGLTDAAGRTSYLWPAWIYPPPPAQTRLVVCTGGAAPGPDDTSAPPAPHGRDALGQPVRIACSGDDALTHSAGERASGPRSPRRSIIDPAVLLSALYHRPPAWYPLPPRGAVDRVLIYVVPLSVHHLVLLGPGITLTHLDRRPRRSGAGYACLPLCWPHRTLLSPDILGAPRVAGDPAHGGHASTLIRRVSETATAADRHPLSAHPRNALRLLRLKTHARRSCTSPARGYRWRAI